MTNELPVGWVRCKLEDICYLDNGNKVSGVNMPLLDVKYIRGKKEAEYRSSGVILEPNDYVILVDGENSGEIFQIHEKGIMGSTFKKVSFKTKETIRYALYVIRSCQKLFRENKKGSAIPHLDKKLFKEYPINLPPLAEQKRIVGKIEELFAEVDKGIDLLKQKQAELKKYRQSVLSAAFSGKLYKTTEWQTVQLKDICDVNPKTEVPSFSDEEIVSFLPMPSVEAEINSYQEEKTEYKKVKKGYTKFQNKDVLFAKITPCMENGKGCIVDNLRKGVGFGSTEFHVLRSNGRVLPKLLILFVLSLNFRKEAKMHMTGAVGQQRVPADFIKHHTFLLPTLPEQEQIVVEIEQRFEKADVLEKSIEDALESAEKLKQSILKKAFEGTLVPQDPNDEPASGLLNRIKSEQKKGKKKCVK